MNNLSCNSQGQETTLPARSVTIFSRDTVNAFLYVNHSPQRSLFERLDGGLPGEAAEQFDGSGCVTGVVSAAGCSWWAQSYCKLKPRAQRSSP